MITGPKFKICRRLGPGVFEKCQTEKFARAEANRTPRQGSRRPGARTDFATQLLEKQRVRFTYRLSEKQFSNYVKKAVAKKADSREALFENLETRLDNIAFRLGFAHTRGLARQLVSHGHITINGKRVTIPSYKVSMGDIVGIRDGSKASPVFAALKERYREYTPPNWLKFDVEKHVAEIVGVPKLELGNMPYNLQSVIEFYSR